MRCANHLDRDAIGLCTGCGIALCPSCRASDEVAMCGNCLTCHNKEVIHHFGLRVAGSFGLFLLALGLVSSIELAWAQKLAICLMAAFFPFGWSALSRVFASGEHYPLGLMRVFALLSHASVSALLGWIVGPYQLIKGIREILKARQANASVQSH